MNTKLFLLFLPLLPTLKKNEKSEIFSLKGYHVSFFPSSNVSNVNYESFRIFPMKEQQKENKKYSISSLNNVCWKNYTRKNSAFYLESIASWSR